MERLIDVVEGFQSGERDTAVAGLTDGEFDDLPMISRLKVSPSSIFTLKGSQVAAELGIRAADASYLLSQKDGLDFVGFHQDLWDHETYKRTNRRLWHPRTLMLLAEILDDPGQRARENISAGCNESSLAASRAAAKQRSPSVFPVRSCAAPKTTPTEEQSTTPRQRRLGWHRVQG